jgi:hypothetical protein
MGRPRSDEEQRREVEGWRGSGESAAAYSARRGYSRASLAKWSAALKRSELAVAEPRFVRLEVEPTAAVDLCVEIGEARIRVSHGFDRTLLRGVVDALTGRCSR